MLQQLVANWIRQQAQEAVMQSVKKAGQSEATEAGSDPGTDPGNDGEAAAPPVECKIACIYPSAAEAGGFVDKLSGVTVSKCDGFVERIGLLGEDSIAVIETGAAPEQLAKILHDLIHVRKPSWVVSTGFATALQADVRRGEMIVADRFIDRHEYSLATSIQMPESPGLRVGTLLTLEHHPTTTDAKRKLTSTSALASECQAAVVAEVCRVLKTRMLSVHVVAETLQSKPPTTIDQFKSQDSIAGMLGAAAGAILEKPSSVKDFWHDKEASLRLSDRLAGFLTSMLAQLS